MLNTASVAAVENATWRASFIKPLYDSYGFSSLPTLVQHTLTGEGEMHMPADVLGALPHRHQAVVLFFVDGLGWRFIEPRLERYPFLQHIVKEGAVSKLTSMFPSTTSAHTTTIHTGQPPAQSGVYEWHQYNEQLDRIITPLMFAYPRDKTRDTLLGEGLKMSDVFPSRTIYRDLARAGVKSHVFIMRDLAKSAPTRALSDGATIIPYKTFPEALVNLALLLRLRRQPAYYFVYFSNIDTVCHDYGPGSAQVDAEIDAFFTMLERTLLPAARDTGALLLVTADHGQVEVGDRVVPLQRDLVKHLSMQSGEGRFRWLHARSGRVSQVLAAAEAHADVAWVVTREEVVDGGWFGPKVSDDAIRRLGDVALVARADVSFYDALDTGPFSLVGRHGSLTAAEMRVPLIAASS